MPQEERPDERRSCDVVVEETGRDFEFTDLTGGVDYTARDGLAVLEVTRFTNRLLRMDMQEAARQDHVLDLGTGYDWWVTFDGHPHYQDLVGRLYHPLLALETHGLEQYDRDRMDWWLRHVPTLRDDASSLRGEGVIHARAMLTGEQPTRLFISSSGGWVYGGPDAALELLEEAVVTDVRHLQKLGRTDALERHLWLWTDAATTGDFRRGLEVDEQRLPSRPPKLPTEVTHLWCVDESYGRGWRWGPVAGWAWVKAAPAPSTGE